jgi:DNA (cytosine-5)-methyltransferase 1
VKLKAFELFGGIGAPRKSLRRLNISHEVVGISEWDVNAAIAYSAVHTNNKIEHSKGLTKAEILEYLEPFTFSTNGKSPCNKDRMPEKTLRLLYNAQKNTNNYGSIVDIKTKDIPDFDLLTWGFPCQDISVAGKQAGIVKGETRSGLYYEGLRILKDKRPTYSLIENVKNLTSKKFKPQFEQMLKDLEELGYNNYYPDLNKSHSLNAKECGIPQNRERVFILSILNENDPYDMVGFPWPKPFDNGLRLKHLLEDEVDEKYYVSDEKCRDLIISLNKSDVGVMVKEATKKGFAVANRGDSINLEQPNSKTRRGRVGVGVAQTLTTSCNQAVVEPVRLGGIFDTEKSKHQAGAVWDKEGLCPTLDTMQGGYRQPSILTETSLQDEQSGNMGNYRIRKLTPKECWRLMGFDDVDFDKAEKVCSNSQLYKQAGNSIVVNVLDEIFKELFKDYIQQDDDLSFLD